VVASERTRHRRGALLAITVLLTISVSDCGEFAHTNPFDPAVPVNVTITGPDSAFAQFDTLHFALTTDPAYDYADVQWEMSGLQRIDNSGTYRVGAIENYAAKPITVTVTARVDSRTASKTVNVVFRPAVFRARNCVDDSRSLTLDALADFIFVCTAAYDRHGGFIGKNVEIAPDQLVEQSLDTTIVKRSPSARIYTTVGNGTTSLVFKYGALADTMQVTVRQAVRGLTLVSPANCYSGLGVPLSVGQQVQLSIGAPARDRNGYVVTDPVLVQRAVADMSWSLIAYRRYDGTIPPIPPVSVTPEGLVTAKGDGLATLAASPSTSGSTVYSVLCYVDVN
jgi:hypothetical protein